MDPQFEVLPPERRFPQPPRPKRGGLIGFLIAIGALVVKFGTYLLVFAKTGITMLLSIGAYALLFGWKFSVGLVLLIFVHEMGHIVAAKAYRIQVSVPVFIPLFGAYVLLKNRPQYPYSNAIISYAGPLAGGLGGWLCYGLGNWMGIDWLMAVAFYTFVLNMINLLPLPGWDGSHIFACFFPPASSQVTLEDRIYLGIFTVALIAAMVLGCLHSYHYLPAV